MSRDSTLEPVPVRRFCPRSRVRCQYRERPNGYRRERDGGHDLRTMKFKCRWCKAWVCGECEGTHDDADPVGNKLCDPCWARRMKSAKPGGKLAKLLLLEDPDHEDHHAA